MTKRAPIIASSAFKKIKTPELLLSALQDHCKLRSFTDVSMESTWDQDYLAFGKAGIYNLDERNVTVRENLISSDLENLGYKLLTPEVSSWAEVPVIRSWGYGVREYTNGCRLAFHRDRKDSHVLSAIVHVEDVSDKPWPLDFIDHKGVHHEVIMEVGDTLLYESFCPHGRNNPFKGLYYRNTYFHWRPEEWDPSLMDGVKVKYSSLNQAIKDMSVEE